MIGAIHLLKRDRLLIEKIIDSTSPSPLRTLDYSLNQHPLCQEVWQGQWIILINTNLRSQHPKQSLYIMNINKKKRNLMRKALNGQCLLQQPNRLVLIKIILMTQLQSYNILGSS
jgi:hypothetical protein